MRILYRAGGAGYPMTYDEIRKQRCPWCKEGLPCSGYRHIRYCGSDHSCDRWMDQTYPCTAPTPEQVIDELSAKIVVLEADIAPGQREYRSLSDENDALNAEIAQLRTMVVC